MLVRRDSEPMWRRLPSRLLVLVCLALTAMHFIAMYHQPSNDTVSGAWRSTVVLFRQSQRNDRHPAPENIVNNIRVIDPSSVAFLPAPDDCLTVRVDSEGPAGGRSFPICPYPAADDPHVSGGIRRGHYYEENKVRQMLRMLRRATADYGDKIFIDVGTNVGVYSVAIGHAGYKVISVEPNAQTMRYLATSVLRGHLSDHVTLLHNAVSNERATLRLAVETRNRGNSFLLPTDVNCTDDGRVSTGIKCQTNVLTVTLDDLLSIIQPQLLRRTPTVVVKVDAQGSEMKIFDPDTSAEFFRRLNVFAIQMEWELIASNYTKLDARRSEANRVIDFLRNLNFTFHPLEGDTNEILGADWSKWPYDILLIRR